MKSKSKRHKLVQLASLAAFVCFSLQPADAQLRQPGAAPKGDLNTWEQRLLGRPYSHDPLDKRIQRLELLVFGGTQDGSLSERLSALKTEISSRAGTRVSKGNVSQSLNQLEQKILKKTFASESVDVRLARLETKLFGKSNPSMSESERIERLKKTIGLGEPPPIADSSRGGNFFGGPLGRDFNDFNRDFGGGSIVIPFGSGTQSMMPEDLNRQMSQMFRQLNQQLRDLHRMPNGDSHVMPFPGPGLKSFPPGTQLTPNFPTVPDHQETEVPPYLDPNSI